jgi:hypothetical protein
LQFLTQYVEFAHAGFDQLQFVAQKLRHGVVRVWSIPQRGNAVADLAEGKSQALRVLM